MRAPGWHTELVALSHEDTAPGHLLLPAHGPMGELVLNEGLAQGEQLGPAVFSEIQNCFWCYQQIAPESLIRKRGLNKQITRNQRQLSAISLI